VLFLEKSIGSHISLKTHKIDVNYFFVLVKKPLHGPIEFSIRLTCLKVPIKYNLVGFLINNSKNIIKSFQ